MYIYTQSFLPQPPSIFHPLQEKGVKQDFGCILPSLCCIRFAAGKQICDGMFAYIKMV